MRDRRALRLVIVVLLAMPDLGCRRTGASPTIDELADRYVKLVLSAGVQDPQSVDAYYGPAEWRAEAERAGKPLSVLRSEADDLLRAVRSVDPGKASPERRRYLERQTQALATRLEILGGSRLSFDRESELLYGIVAPPIDDSALEPLMQEMERAVPGSGPLAPRLEAFGRKTAVSAERLPHLVEASLAVCRSRTLAHVTLPDSERVEVSYVRGQPWSAYARYRGDFRTTIEINDAMPRRPDQVLDLICHEAYPGHHTQYSLTDSRLVRGRGWRERQILALFSPASAIAEGAATAGIDVVFPSTERETYVRDTLFPLAGLSAEDATTAWRVRQLTDQLATGANEGARRYLDGRMSRAQATLWLERHAAMPQPMDFLAFAEEMRSYVVGYTEAAVRVQQYVEGDDERGGVNPWSRLEQIILNPMTPGLLGREAPREYQSSRLLPHTHTPRGQ